MLTELLGFRVRDEHGRRTRVSDLCVTLLEDDYPPVTHLLAQHHLELVHLDWAEVVSIDPKKRLILVKDLALGRRIDDDSDVLLRRDILDALVIDLLGRRTTRVNDIALEIEDGSLRVMGADAGLASMIRRITRGRVGRVDRDAMFDWKYIEFLRGDPGAVDSGAGYRRRINRLPAGEIARLADLIPYLHAAELIKLLPDNKAAIVLQAMSVERQLQVIEELPEDEAADLVSLMSHDLATDLVGRLDMDKMKRCLARLPEAFRDCVIELLKYPEHTVGGVMVNDVIRLSSDLSGSLAQEKIRQHLISTAFTSVVFVVDADAEHKLVGVVPLRDVLTVEDDVTLDQIMDPYVDVLDPYRPASEAAYRIIDSGLAAMPVVGDEGRFVGAMTIDAAIAQLVTPAVGLQSLRVFT